MFTMKPTPPRSIAHAITQGLVRAVFLTVCIIAAVTIAATGEPAPAAPLNKPHAEGSPADLIDRHGCWTDQAPADVVIPGHVVVTEPGSDAPVLGGRAMVAKALGQVFDGEDHGLTIHAFCR